MKNTIAAISTAPGHAGIAVVRVSGEEAFEIARRITGKKSAATPSATHCTFSNPETGERIDDGILLLFKSPRSYTGEDVAELQGHGGMTAARRLLAAALAAGARLAQPGEFTRRAFLGGKLDLTQAEAVMDLIRARTDRAAAAAHEQIEGALGNRVKSLAAELRALRADVEALLDFDEGEVPPTFNAQAKIRTAEIKEKLRALAAERRTGRLLREGAKVVISGEPNAGKSTLLNALLGVDRAIVSSTPGTTRDSIEEAIEIDGIPVRLIDTAGLRAADSEIEAQGVERARRLIDAADINIRLVDATAEIKPQACELAAEKTILVYNKIDLPQAAENSCAIAISAKTGAGIDRLRAALAAELSKISSADDAEISERQIGEMRAAMEELSAAENALLGGDAGLVLAAHSLAIAAQALGRITGEVWSDDLLDAIFSRFCVGK